MKTFKTAAIQADALVERDAKIKELIAAGKTQSEAEAEADEDGDFIAFMLDDRKMKAYAPTPGQLAFMIASMGRGQDKHTRFAGIFNILMACLDEEDQDHLEGRLLSRKRSERLELEQLEEIFEHLTTEWFADPTQGS